MGAENSFFSDDVRPAQLLARARQDERPAATIVLVSGGFDPLHIGHLRMLQAAHEYGRVYIALNSDKWLARKKGYAFMTWENRAEILRDLRSVFAVIRVRDNDGTVCEALDRLRPHYFANGGDRIEPNSTERDFCERAGIEQIFGIGGGKIESSSALVLRCGAHDPHKDAVPG